MKLHVMKEEDLIMEYVHHVKTQNANDVNIHQRYAKAVQRTFTYTKETAMKSVLKEHTLKAIYVNHVIQDALNVKAALIIVKDV